MSERDIYLNENASAFEECRELHAAIARALAGEADAVTKAAQAFTELSRVESERDRLRTAIEAALAQRLTKCAGDDILRSALDGDDA